MGAPPAAYQVPRHPPTPTFGTRWTGPAAPPSRAVLGAAAAGGLVLALSVPEGPPGVGWFVVAVSWALLAVLVRWHARPVPPAAADLRSGAGWGALAVGFAAVSALRDAGWLVQLCVLAAMAAGSLAVAGRSFRGIGTGAVVVWAAAARAIPWAARGTGRTGSRSARTALSVLVGVGLLAVFGVLLASADAAFASLFGSVLPALDGGSAVRAVVLGVVGALFVLGAAFLLVAPPEPPGPAPRPVSRLRPAEWALPLGGLTALFAVFVVVQVVTLLGGDAYVRATTGVTYAEYARSGFWQLLAVTVLALGVIVLGQRWAPPGRGRPLLAALALLTIAIVATAIGRMWLYQQAYGFTVARLLVLVCELWLGVAFALVLVAVLRRGAPMRGVVTSGAVLLLALALGDPERFVAARNVERFAATGQLDVGYLGTLSADAVPALDALPESSRSCVLSMILVLPDPDWRSANASRATAAGIRHAPSTCASATW